MNASQLRIVMIGSLYLLLFGSGFWLTRAGKPYSTIVVTVHKLISVAALVLLAVSLYQINRGIPLGAVVIAAGVITGLFFLGTIATGAMLTAERQMPTVVLWLHRITPFLTVIATAVTLYLRLGNG
jgi:hypothetical protein